MNNSTKVAIYLIGLGMALTAFAFNNFATKDEMSAINDKVNTIHEDMRIIQSDVKILIRRKYR